MQCLCAEIKKGKNANGTEEEPCDHSYCTVQRQKKDTKCLDIPPKGLPWATGYLKYLPGQRGYYKDLYLKEQADLAAAKMAPPPCPCPPKKPKAKSCKPQKQSEPETTCLCICAPTNGCSKKKARKKSGKRRSSAASQMTSDNQNCCFELEKVFICDGTSPQPRQGFMVRPCKRPEAEMAISAVEDARSQQSGDETGEDKGMICLCVPRQYLQQWRGPEEDLCAKYGIPQECPPPKPSTTNSKASLGSKKSEGSKKLEEEAPPDSEAAPEAAPENEPEKAPEE